MKRVLWDDGMPNSEAGTNNDNVSLKKSSQLIPIISVNGKTM